MGYILPKKSSTWKQVEELIRRRQAEEERQRMFQDEMDLRADSQRRLQERAAQEAYRREEERLRSEIESEGPIPGYESQRRRETSRLGGDDTVGAMEDRIAANTEARRVRDEQARATRVSRPT